MISVEDHEIRTTARCDLTDRLRQRTCSSDRDRIEEAATDVTPEWIGVDREHIPSLVNESLSIFQQTKLFGDVDRRLAVAADRELSTELEQLFRCEQAVPEVCFGGGADRDHRAARGDEPPLVFVEMRRVYQTPSLVDLLSAEEPRYRSFAEVSEALIELELLLCDVNVDRRGAIDRRDHLDQ